MQADADVRATVGAPGTRHARAGGPPENRDNLAFVRTVLALERTALAYVRTALALAAVAVAVGHFFPGAWLAVWTLGALAGGMFAAAAYRTARVARSLRDIRQRLGTSSLRMASDEPGDHEARTYR